MEDVLKLAEQALERMAEMGSADVPQDDYEAMYEFCERQVEKMYDQINPALTALRAARAECGLRPIAELTTADEFNQSTILGRWGFGAGNLQSAGALATAAI